MRSREEISILVVDDDPTTMFMLETILKEYGHRCIAAENVGEAKRILQESTFDLVLTEIKMPRESGLDLIAHVNDNYPQVACVVVTSMDDPEEAEDILRLGVHGYIVKPFTANIVEIAIQSALRHHRLELQERALNQNLQLEIEKKTQTLNEQLSFLQTLLDSIPIPVYYKDRNLVYIGCNKAFEEITGYDKASIIGNTSYGIHSRQLADKFSSADNELLKTGVHKILEYDLVDRNGVTHPTIIQKARYLDHNGEVAGIIGVGLDITELKAVEASLRTSEGKLRSIMDNLPVGVILLDQAKKVLTANRLIRKWFDVDGDLHSLEEKLVASSVKPQFCHIHNAGECVETIDTPSGEKVFRTILSEVYGDENNILSTVKIFEDITQRLEIERELRQAQKLESIGQLAAGIAHEINTPMQYVGDNLNFLADVFKEFILLYKKYHELFLHLKEENPASELIGDVEEVIEDVDPGYLMEEIPVTISQSLDGVQRVNTIVRAMREFSHPGTEDKIELDINKVLQNTIIVSRNEWKYVADVETRLAPDLPAPMCLPGEINQVFLNILINAAHAIEDAAKKNEGEDGKGRITVTTGHEQNYCVIRISDTGDGIPENIRTRIFDPFFTTKEVGKGTGQGLAIAHNVIVEKHQGQLLFETKTNEGTTFIIKLPVQEG